jgi:hypothetical protein
MECQCEHVCHFDERATHDHKYGTEQPDVQSVKLRDMGTWKLCKVCRDECQYDNLEVRTQ